MQNLNSFLRFLWTSDNLEIGMVPLIVLHFGGYNIKPCHFLVAGHKKDIKLQVIHLLQSQKL